MKESSKSISNFEARSANISNTDSEKELKHTKIKVKKQISNKISSLKITISKAQKIDKINK